MITIRGKTVIVKPLTATQIGEVLDSVRELGKCTPTIRVMEPEMLPMPQIDSAPECTPCTNESTPKCDGPCHHKGCCPHTDKACPATPRGEEEPSEAAHTSVRRKLSIFHIYDCDDACPKHPDVDTMEYRSSDRHLYDYGPGSL